MRTQIATSFKPGLFASPTRVRMRLVLECEAIIEALQDEQDTITLTTEDDAFRIETSPDNIHLERYIDMDTRDELWDELRRVRGVVEDLTIVPVPVFTAGDNILRPDRMGESDAK